MRRLAVLLILCGCRHPPPAPARPRAVTVHHVQDRLEGQSLFRAELVSVWAIENGLEEPITVRHWHYDSTLEGRPLAEAAVEPELALPAGGKAQVAFHQPLELETVFPGRTPSYANHVASIAPEVKGLPHAATEQSLKLPQAPAMKIGALHVTKTPRTFDVLLTLSVVNDNAFPVVVERFDGEVLFAGDRFARFTSATPLTLAPGTPHPVPLELTSSIARLNGLSRAALSSTEAVSTDVKLRALIEGRELSLATGSMVWPR